MEGLCFRQESPTLLSENPDLVIPFQLHCHDPTGIVMSKQDVVFGKRELVELHDFPNPFIYTVT